MSGFQQPSPFWSGDMEYPLRVFAVTPGDKVSWFGPVWPDRLRQGRQRRCEVQNVRPICYQRIRATVTKVAKFYVTFTNDETGKLFRVRHHSLSRVYLYRALTGDERQSSLARGGEKDDDGV